MSFKSQVVPEGHTFVLPPIKTMRAPVRAFLSPDLFALTDEKLWEQAYNAASYPGVTDVFLMPDTHIGFGIPIGGVVVTRDTIIQAGSGYDISCGILHLKVPGLLAEHIVNPALRLQWLRELERHIASGVGASPTDTMAGADHRTLEDIFRYGAQVLGVSSDVCERQYIPVDEKAYAGNKDIRKTKPIKKALGKAGPQLGSLGGGNHFIEMQVDEATAEVWVMVHCGSRGYGWNVADYFFKTAAELRGLPRNRREESYVRLDEPLGQEYWAWHNSAANYAIANRHTIAKGIRRATQDVFGETPEVFYEISHNLVQNETQVLPDGSTTSGLVHRKGATRAMPAGHPDLVGTKWASTGHPCLIPGSMFDGAAILYPWEGAYQSGCSVNHGSGRVLGRGAAKREFAECQKMINDEMSEVSRNLGGVEVIGTVSNQENIPLDECAHVYKALDPVLDVLQKNNVALVNARLHPVANLKGND